MTDIKDLTVERTLELLREVVAEFGEDYVYTDFNGNVAPYSSCYYVHGDKPGCIAGHVYHRAGLTIHELAVTEGQGATATYFLSKGVSDDAASILREAQLKQDEGDTWGEALAAAEEYATSLREVA